MVFNVSDREKHLLAFIALVCIALYMLLSVVIDQALVLGKNLTAGNHWAIRRIQIGVDFSHMLTDIFDGRKVDLANFALVQKFCASDKIISRMQTAHM